MNDEPGVRPNRRALWILTAIWVPLVIAGIALDSALLDGLAFVIVGLICVAYNRESATSARLIGPFRARRVESVVLGVLVLVLGLSFAARALSAPRVTTPVRPTTTEPRHRPARSDAPPQAYGMRSRTVTRA